MMSILTLALVLVGGGGAATGVGATGTGGWIDTQDRAAVLDAHAREFSKVTPDMGWTGDRASCTPGTTSQAYRNATIDRVNYFRAMAGVPTGVVENTTWSAQAQQAALSMSATGKLSHNPDSSWNCLNATVSASAVTSNLYLGRTGPEAITGYMFDPGANNTSVGHRSWIYHSTLTQIGTGDLPSAPGHYSANTLQVIDSQTAFAAEPALRESQGFVAWPVRGYNPGSLVFPRWSFTLRGASFEWAQVSVTRDGQPIASPVVHRSIKSNGAPFPNIVWEPVGVDTAPDIDQVYTVTVSNVAVGSQRRTYSYDVILIGARPAVLETGVVHDRYITTAYQDFMGRNPSATELARWNAHLNSGPLDRTRTSFVSELASSREWTLNVVDGLYRDTLSRSGDQAGRLYWSQLLQQGTPVASIAASFYGSPEYVTRSGSTYDRWVGQLYGVLLSRNPDAEGLGYWAREADRQGSQTVAFGFYQSEESRASRVADLYRTLLGRDPDPAGQRYWVGVLASGNDLELAAFLASSEEYYARS